MINDWYSEGAERYSACSEPSSGDEKFESSINPWLAHLSKRQTNGKPAAKAQWDACVLSARLDAGEFEYKTPLWSEWRQVIIYAKKRRMAPAHQNLLK